MSLSSCQPSGRHDGRTRTQAPADTLSANVPQTAAHSRIESPMSGNNSVLDPVDRFSEVLFGLIMVLGITGSVSAATAGRQEIGTLLVSALGCNVAWGIVDAVMFLMTTKLERGHALRLLRQLKGLPDDHAAAEAIRESAPTAFSAALSGPELDVLAERLRELPDPPGGARLTGADIRGSIGIMLLVTLVTVPVSVPFLVLADVGLALRLSRLVALVMLFAGGWGLGRYAGFSPFRTGVLMLALGGVLVGVTVALGG